jgi:L-fuculose-phosphate aldolase
LLPCRLDAAQAWHKSRIRTELTDNKPQLAIAVERAAQLQILASSAGTIKPIPSHLACEARDYGKKPIYSHGMCQYDSGQILRDATECLD